MTMNSMTLNGMTTSDTTASAIVDSNRTATESRATHSVAMERLSGAIASLRALLARGGVLAVPTESSYGLAADPRSAIGVAAVSAIKGRDVGKPLPIAGANVDALLALGIEASDPALVWARRHWPAPLTAIVPLRASAPAMPATAGLRTVAVRVPAHQGLRDLLAALDTPLTVTSANRAGAPPILEPHALQGLLRGADAIIMDGGVLAGGPPSTLVRWHDHQLQVLRAGAHAMTHSKPHGEGR